MKVKEQDDSHWHGTFFFFQQETLIVCKQNHILKPQ